MNDEFLLDTSEARSLYHQYAEKLPVIDYHNHLAAKEVLTDYSYENITELWLRGDPYKHRAMRMCGIEEKYITGNASDYEKFNAWCTVFPRLTGNPLKHWSQMELSMVFNLDIPICTENAQTLWNRLNEMLKDKAYTSRGILSRFNIEYCSPCMLLNDDISGFKDKSAIAPSLRSDDMKNPTPDFIQRLSENTGIHINSIEALKQALGKRFDVFDRAGGKFFDYAADDGFQYKSDDGQNEDRLKKLISDGELSDNDMLYFNSELLRIAYDECAMRGWTVQLHIGALRYTSSRLRRIAGPAGGFAGIGNFDVRHITRLLDDVEGSEHGLARTLLFTLNPAYNEEIAVLCGSYSCDNMPSPVQQGPAWWWCDHYSGITGVLDSISSFGLLYEFIGMTTDSRSVLSFVRHDYFRRVLCAWIGRQKERGIFTEDTDTLGELVKRICCKNAAASAGIKKEIL